MRTLFVGLETVKKISNPTQFQNVSGDYNKFVWIYWTYECTIIISILSDETLGYLVKCGQEIACPTANVWYPVCQKTYFQLHDKLLTIFYQVLPSAIMDLFIKSSKFKLLPLCRKISAMAEVIQFFNHHNFNFAKNNLMELQAKCVTIGTFSLKCHFNHQFYYLINLLFVRFFLFVFIAGWLNTIGSILYVIRGASIGRSTISYLLWAHVCTFYAIHFRITAKIKEECKFWK